MVGSIEAGATWAQEQAALKSIAMAWPILQTSVYPSWNANSAISACVSPYWAGLTCQTSTGPVTALYLNGTWLAGPIPEALFGLTNLFTLQLSYAGITGTISSNISLLTSVSTLSFQNNPSLTGSIPSTISSLTQLNQLYLGSTGLNGLVPASISSLTHLSVIDLSFTRLTGPILDFLAPIPSLGQVSINNCQFTGTIPMTFLSAPKMQELFIQENLINGTIPDTIGSFLKVQILDMYGNNLTGSIPSSIGELRSLYLLDVSVNQMTGTIPSQIGNTSLTQFYINNNSFSGTLPSTMQQLSSLTDFNAQDNQLQICDGWHPGTTMAYCNIAGQVVPPGTTNNTYCPNIWYSCIYSNITELSSPPIPMSAPVSLPTSPSVSPITMNPVSAPIIVPQDSNCAGIQPAPSFECQNGVWVATGDVTAPALTISGPTSIDGNLNITTSGITVTSIVGSGTGANGQPITLVKGCLIDNTDSGFAVIVELSASDIDKIYSSGGHTQTLALIGQDSNCSVDLSQVQYSVKTGSTCKTVTVKSASSSSTMALLFTVSNINCDIWWIILVSVVAGVIVLALIIFVGLVLFIPAIRSKIFPATKRTSRASTT